MTDHVYLARDFNVSPLWFSSTYGTVTGGSTALDTFDGDTTGANAPGAAQVTWIPSPAGTPAPGDSSLWASVTVRLWWREEGAGPALLDFRYPGSIVQVSLASPPPEPLAGGYYLTTFQIGNPADLPGDVSTWWLILERAFASRFELVISTAGGVPLRIFQRGDGLGAGSGRVLGSGTRQSSSKVLGAL